MQEARAHLLLKESNEGPEIAENPSVEFHPEEGLARFGATCTAVDLPAVAAAANQHWRTTSRADEASGRNAHMHTPGKLPRVCWTESSTGVAP